MIKNKNQILVSVVLSIRNNASFLETSISSIFKQSYKNLEIIAIDDNSIDNSYYILKKLKAKDKRLKIYKNVKNYGNAITLNRCIKKAKGNFLVFMDPKDIMLKTKIQKQVNFLLKNPKTVAIGAQCYFINEESKKIGMSAFPSHPLTIQKNPMHGISIFFEGLMINRFLIPKDLLYFTTNNDFLYSSIAYKLSLYGELNNLNSFLFHHRKLNPATHDLSNFLAFFKFWLISKQNDMNVSFKSIFSTAFKYTFLS